MNRLSAIEKRLMDVHFLDVEVSMETIGLIGECSTKIMNFTCVDLTDSLTLVFLFEREAIDFHVDKNTLYIYNEDFEKLKCLLHPVAYDGVHSSTLPVMMTKNQAY